MSWISKHTRKRWNNSIYDRAAREGIYGFLIKAFKFILFFSYWWSNREKMKNYWQTLEIEFFSCFPLLEWEEKEKSFDLTASLTPLSIWFLLQLAFLLCLKSSAISETHREDDDLPMRKILSSLRAARSSTTAIIPWWDWSDASS